MFSLNDSLSYFYFRDATDMRKGFDALCGMVRSQMSRNPLSGEVYIFMNRGRTTVKILRWESGGLVVYHKRLEAGRFEEPIYRDSDKSCHLKWAELVMMIQGISMQNRVQRKRYKIVEKT
jgi:transposase